MRSLGQLVWALHSSALPPLLALLGSRHLVCRPEAPDCQMMMEGVRDYCSIESVGAMRGVPLWSPCRRSAGRSPLM